MDNKISDKIEDNNINKMNCSTIIMRIKEILTNKT